MADQKMWFCKIGEVDPHHVPHSADLPMRAAVSRAFKEVTGMDAEFVFSGWGDQLEECERAVVENRPPVPEPPTYTAAQLSQAVEAAQGAVIEAASNHRFIENADFMGCACGEAFAYPYQSDWRIHLRRVLQTEPMAAALAARDKQLRTEAAKLELDAAVENIRELSHIPLHIRQEIITYVCRCSPLIAAARKETL